MYQSEKFASVGLLLVAIAIGVRYGALPLVLDEFVAGNLDLWTEDSEGQKNFVSFCTYYVLKIPKSKCFWIHSWIRHMIPTRSFMYTT